MEQPKPQRILYHEDMDMFEDNLGGFYISVEEVIEQNAWYYDKYDITYLIEEWTQQTPKRINMNDHSLTWDYDV